MIITIDSKDLREIVYRMLRDIDDGYYSGKTCVCVGLLNAQQTAALDELVKRIEFRHTPEKNEGIKNHDGQKLLVKHILDVEPNLSTNARSILELLIGERQ